MGYISIKDDELKKLANSGLGARKIAKILGIKHSSSVSKRLIKMGIRKGISVIPIPDKLELQKKKCNLPNAAEAYFDYVCCRFGWTFSAIAGESYDRLADFGDGFKKIQIKSSTHKVNDYYSFSLKRTRHNSTSNKVKFYTSSEVDYYFLFAENGDSWLIPFDRLGCNSVNPEKKFVNFKLTSKHSLIY